MLRPRCSTVMSLSSSTSQVTSSILQARTLLTKGAFYWSLELLFQLSDTRLARLKLRVAVAAQHSFAA